MFTSLILFVLKNYSFKQLEPISPDRKDQTESPNVISSMTIQNEAGVRVYV